MNRALLIACGLLAGGCNTYLEEISPAPPGAVATVDDTKETIEISHGAALAFECHYNQGVCTAAKASTENPEVAIARPAFFDELRPGGYDRHTGLYNGTDTRSVFVIVGRQPGKTTLHVEHDDGSTEYEVTVLTADP